MAENRRGRGQRSYYLSRGQLVILALGFAVTSSVVFFLGMLVGQGIEERKLQQKGSNDPVTKIPFPVSPGGARLSGGSQGEQEMTFYETLSKSPQPAKKKVLKEKQVVLPVKKIAKVKATPRLAEKKKSSKVKENQRRSRLSTSRKGSVLWSVQVKAFTRRGDAQILANKLKGKGYDAYLVTITIKGRTWYRVRVGQLATQAQAKTLLERLKRREKFAKAIITRGR